MITIAGFPVPDTRALCDTTLAHYERLIVRIAVWLAKGDETLADDLAQLGRIVVWELDPSRFDESDGKYLFRAILWTMQREVRRRRHPLLSPRRSAREARVAKGLPCDQRRIA